MCAALQARARANGTRCDLLLVDGGHSQRAARNDLLLLRSVAAPHARVVVDDINVDPGVALRRLAVAKAIRVLETYNFKKKSEHNPCQRKPKGKIFPCRDWGFAVTTYNAPGKRVASGELEAESGKRSR